MFMDKYNACHNMLWSPFLNFAESSVKHQFESAIFPSVYPLEAFTGTRRVCFGTPPPPPQINC
ncbi:hypothetical protein Peur_007558 [Populus x canadensis]